MTLEDENWKVLVEHNIEMAKHWKKKYEEAQDYLSGRELWKQRAVSAEMEVDELKLAIGEKDRIINEYATHQYDCLVNQAHSGEPDPKGYKMTYGFGKQQVICYGDEKPDCTCGLKTSTTPNKMYEKYLKLAELLEEVVVSLNRPVTFGGMETTLAEASGVDSFMSEIEQALK